MNIALSQSQSPPVTTFLCIECSISSTLTNPSSNFDKSHTQETCISKGDLQLHLSTNKKGNLLKYGKIVCNLIIESQYCFSLQSTIPWQWWHNRCTSQEGGGAFADLGEFGCCLRMQVKCSSSATGNATSTCSGC